MAQRVARRDRSRPLREQSRATQPAWRQAQDEQLQRPPSRRETASKARASARLAYMNSIAPSDQTIWCFSVIPEEPQRCNGGTLSGYGNPLLPEAGVKWQKELDYQSADGFLIQARVYRSDTSKSFEIEPSYISDFSQTGAAERCFPGTFKITNGSGVTSDYGQHCFHYYASGEDRYQWSDGQGRHVRFLKNGNVFTPSPNINMVLSKSTGQNGTNWNLQLEDNSTNIYDNAGTLLSRTMVDGRKISFQYSSVSTPISVAPRPGLLVSVVDHVGRSLNYRYNGAGFISQFFDPAGGQYGYFYDVGAPVCQDGSCNRLLTTTYPGAVQRNYHWNEPSLTAGTDFPDALTGLTDELGKRVGIYGYNSAGYAISTERANGVDRYQVVSISRNNGYGQGSLTLGKR